jgi:hypothetical protein
MERSIGSARAEVQRAFERARKLADSAPPQRCSDFERELWTAVLALGRALVSLFLAHQAARPRPLDYLHGRQRFVLKGGRVSELGTRFGKVSFVRPLGRCRDAAGRGVAPASRPRAGPVLGLQRRPGDGGYAPLRAARPRSGSWHVPLLSRVGAQPARCPAHGRYRRRVARPSSRNCLPRSAMAVCSSSRSTLAVPS